MSVCYITLIMKQLLALVCCACHHTFHLSEPAFDALSILHPAPAQSCALHPRSLAFRTSPAAHPLNPAPLPQAVEFLTNEGQLYSTIDDQHHRSTSM